MNPTNFQTAKYGVGHLKYGKKASMVNQDSKKSEPQRRGRRPVAH